MSLEFADVFRAIGEPTSLFKQFDGSGDGDDELLTAVDGVSTAPIASTTTTATPTITTIDATKTTMIAHNDLCPLFVHLNVAISGADGQFESAPIGSIPNCLLTITQRCSTRVLAADTDGLRGALRVTVSLYILTWPMPAQSPFRVIDPHLVHSNYQASDIIMSS